MNLVIGGLPYFGLAFLLAFLLTPVVKRIGEYIGAYAKENARTVHHDKIVRLGGLAIYLAFLITMSVLVGADKTINGILIGGLIIFLGGVLDDLFDLRPMVKLLCIMVAALVPITYGGIELSILNFFGKTIYIESISFAISFLWIVGVANAINLIDGLDGLAGGISFIVICVIGIIGFLMGRRDVCIISLVLLGATSGFLPYNFHPAKIFMGDCGALFIGYMIACLGLLGFKTPTFITLGFPIMVLFVPLADTCIAIIRRKVKGQKVSQADKSHLHHILMYKMGLSHRNTVILLYIVTSIFGIDALITYYNDVLGMIILVILCIVVWTFIELTGMINPHFHPLVGLCRRIIGYPKKSANAFFEANKLEHREK